MPNKKIIKKSELDQFYTRPEIAKLCFDRLLKYTQDIDFFVEPSAGNGAFSSLISCMAYDVEPKHDEIEKKNWFEIELSQKNICVFGNPPFGERNNLSKAFITHALAMPGVRIIGFVLPEVFCKYTYQKIFPINWGLIDELILPQNAFLLNDKEYSVPCVFQIWQKNLRKPVDKRTSCDDFDIVSRNDAPDLFVFGAAPQKIITPDEVNKNNRGYFLKIKTDKTEIIQRFKTINWRQHGKSSVNGGVFWLTATELIQGYENG